MWGSVACLLSWGFAIVLVILENISMRRDKKIKEDLKIKGFDDKQDAELL